MTYVPTQDDSVLRLLPIAKVQPRANTDLRELRPAHVVDVAATICGSGLLHPIAVDSRYRLVAGKHRLAAFQLLSGLKACRDIDSRLKLLDTVVGQEGAGAKLKDELAALDVAKYEEKHPGGVIPCRLMPYDSEKEPGLAVVAEAIENFEREGYTPKEVKEIATRLQDYGYVDVSGRPSNSQKPLKPALAMIVGKSLRQVQRMLKKADGDTPSAKPASPLPALLRSLERALPEIQASRSPKLKAAAGHFVDGLKELKAYLEEHPEIK